MRLAAVAALEGLRVPPQVVVDGRQRLNGREAFSQFRLVQGDLAGLALCLVDFFLIMSAYVG